MATIPELLECIDDLENDDSTKTYALVDELTESRDRSLVPPLVAALDTFLADENFYGRDVIATALMQIDGVESLPVLLRASAVDIGDDQDSFYATILDAISLDTSRAGEIVDSLAVDADPRVREVAAWAREMVVFEKSQG